jgi:lipopolysaccharide biosynthesis regulator YciM
MESGMSDMYNSKIALLVGKLNHAKGDYAVTINSETTLYSCPEEFVTDQWRAHENCHKQQIKLLGWWLFMKDYLIENVAKGYQNNKFEIEARGEK